MAAYGVGMRVIATFFGPYAPDALTAHVSVFSHNFKRFERLTKLATSSLDMAATSNEIEKAALSARIEGIANPRNARYFPARMLYSVALQGGLDHGTGHFPTGLPLSSPWWTQRRWW